MYLIVKMQCISTRTYSSSKYVEVRYYWICNALEIKQLSLEKIHTIKNNSDMVTTILPEKKTYYFVKRKQFQLIMTQLIGERVIC